MGGMMGVAGMGVALLAFLVPLVVVLGGQTIATSYWRRSTSR
jgi:hypothetical protein